MTDQSLPAAPVPTTRLILATLLATGALSLLFLAFPRIDIWVSSLFYRPENGGFSLGWRPPLTTVRTFGHVVIWLVVAALIASVVIKLARPTRPSPISPSTVNFMLWSLALGPGLLVNLLFKNYWGRPRPEQLEMFGGDAPYIAVWTHSDLCHLNCSFVSGEASAAIWLAGLALVVPRRWRIPTLVVTLLFATAMSVNRIAFGSHFVSDVVIGWGLTILVMLAVYRFFFVHPPASLTGPSLEAMLTRAGLRLQRRAPGAAA